MVSRDLCEQPPALASGLVMDLDPMVVVPLVSTLAASTPRLPTGPGQHLEVGSPLRLHASACPALLLGPLGVLGLLLGAFLQIDHDGLAQCAVSLDADRRHGIPGAARAHLLHQLPGTPRLL